MTDNQSSQPRHTYIQDPESSTEMARLMLQDRLVTEGMHGIFPEHSTLDHIHTILDVGCGPGGWALDVAHTYPDRKVFGIDISATMITYAQAQAQAQRLRNVTFIMMNALEPLKFAAGTFDLVNVRLATGYIPRVQWPPFLQGSFRVLRPGGILRLTEPELAGLTNSPACEQMNAWVALMGHRKGYGFSHDGSHFGMMPMLGLLLQQVGCVNIGFKPHILDFSVGTALHESQYQNYMVWYALLKPQFIHMGITTEATFDQTYNTMLDEMQAPDFRALWSLLTVWGETPA